MKSGRITKQSNSKRPHRIADKSGSRFVLALGAEELSMKLEKKLKALYAELRNINYLVTNVFTNPVAHNFSKAV